MKPKYYKNRGLTTTHNRVDSSQKLIKKFAKQEEKKLLIHLDA
jgi:hypothetical protein